MRLRIFGPVLEQPYTCLVSGLVSWRTKYRRTRTLIGSVVTLALATLGKVVTLSGKGGPIALVQPQDQERGGRARARRRRRSSGDASRRPQLGSLHHGVREATR